MRRRGEGSASVRAGGGAQAQAQRSLVGLLGIVLATGSLNATVLVPVDLGELAAEAHAIARGRVVAVEGRVSDDRRDIETLVTLEPESWLKAPASGLPETVQFRVPGGQVGRYRRIVLGAPEFLVGQRVVVFLGGSAPRVPHVIGLSQGVFRLAPGSGGWTIRANRATPAMSLEAFEARVRTLTGGAR